MNSDNKKLWIVLVVVVVVIIAFVVWFAILGQKGTTLDPLSEDERALESLGQDEVEDIEAQLEEIDILQVEEEFDQADQDLESL